MGDLSGREFALSPQPWQVMNSAGYAWRLKTHHGGNAMAMKKTWDSADTESAIHRGNGNLLKDLKAGTLKDYAQARQQYTASA